MKSKQCCKVLFLVMIYLFVTTAFGDENKGNMGIKLQNIQAKTKRLENEVSALKNELHSLKQQKEPMTAKSQADRDELGIRFLEGTPVATSPYLGIRSEFDGSDLIVNIPSVNEDLRLLKQRQKLEEALKKQGKEFPDNPFLEVSGKLEGQTFYQRPYVGDNSTDIDLTAAEVVTHVTINRYVSGLIAINYDNAPVSSGGQRVDNSRLFLNKAFMTVGNLNDSNFYGSIGQLFVPFGQYSSNMLSSTLPQLVGSTRARAILLGYKQPGESGVYASLFTFANDGNSVSMINNGGVNLAYSFAGNEVSGEVGSSYIIDIAQAGGMQITGNSGFKGFGDTSASETRVHKVGGADIRGRLGYSHYSAIAEYTAAVTPFSSADMTYNGAGARPQALNVEAAYAFNILNRNASFAVGYGQSWQALALNLPQRRYSTAMNMNIWKDTITTIEYRHDVNYGAGDTAGGRAANGGFATVPTAGLGRTSDAVTLQFGIYF